MKLKIALAIPLLGIMGGNALATIAYSTPVFTIAVATPPLSTASESFKLVQNLTPQEINLRAKQFTVRIDGASIGTGAIIDETDTTYTVLTNWHVVKEPGTYSVQTIDGRKHKVDYSTVRQLPNLDLAILQFNRRQNYQLAELGNSSSLIEGENIYFAGYPGELRQEDNRYYRFFPASLVGILSESTANGYALIYNGEAFPGMSGSPVLNSRGFLVGIHGETNIHAITGGTSNYAIPIERYQAAVAQLASSSDSDSSDSNPASDTTPANEEANPSVTVETIDKDNSASSETPQNELVATETLEPETDAPNNNSADNRTTSLNSSATTDSEPQSLFKDVPVPNSNNSATETTSPSESEATPQLLSPLTGIDYTSLKNLLANQQWEQANRKTRHSIARIIDTAKRKDRRSSTNTNAIADFACQDIRIIDRLWQQHSDGKFGFTPQQAVWQQNRSNIGFTLNAWRSFATTIGWKKGEINNGGGYLLYEQLDFNPQTAPQGHLPWWFAASEEQQDIIKTVFNRCSLQEDEPSNEVTSDNLETEAEQNSLSR